MRKFVLTFSAAGCGILLVSAPQAKLFDIFTVNKTKKLACFLRRRQIFDIFPLVDANLRIMTLEGPCD
jgi:hypothetical protein